MATRTKRGKRKGRSTAARKDAAPKKAGAATAKRNWLPGYRGEQKPRGGKLAKGRKRTLTEM